MLHEPIHDGLEAYLSGRLSSCEQERFSSHLAQCVSIEGPFADYTLDLARGYWLQLPVDPPHASP